MTVRELHDAIKRAQIVELYRCMSDVRYHKIAAIVEQASA